MTRKIHLREGIKTRIILSILVLLIFCGELCFWFSDDEIPYDIAENAFFLQTDELMTLLVGIAGIAGAIYSLCILWMNGNILVVDEQHIILRRKRYTYEISFLKIRGVTLLKKASAIGCSSFRTTMWYVPLI